MESRTHRSVSRKPPGLSSHRDACHQQVLALAREDLLVTLLHERVPLAINAVPDDVDVAVHVDEPGHHGLAATVDDLRAGWGLRLSTVPTALILSPSTTTTEWCSGSPP